MAAGCYQALSSSSHLYDYGKVSYFNPIIEVIAHIDTQTPIYFRQDCALTNELQFSNIFFNRLAPMTIVSVCKIDII